MSETGICAYCSPVKGYTKAATFPTYLLNCMDDLTQTVTPSSAETSIFAIIVLYKTLPTESPALQTLLEAMRAVSSYPLRLSIMIADNTPGGQDPGILPEQVRYRRFPENPGLAKPYNDALMLAEAEGFTWFLTLDQDTHLPTTFLTSMELYAKQYSTDDRVAAIVPRIVDRGKLISPFRFVGGFFPWVLAPEAKGISKRFTSAINSSSLLRVDALRRLGGYDLQFPLHNSDTSLFHHLDRAGKRLVVAADIRVNHELAILQLQDRTIPERYHQLLADERAFWDLHMGFLGKVERLLRLVGRVCKDLLRRRNKEFRMISLSEIKLRLMTPKRQRIEAWKQGRS